MTGALLKRITNCPAPGTKGDPPSSPTPSPTSDPPSNPSRVPRPEPASGPASVPSSLAERLWAVYPPGLMPNSITGSSKGEHYSFTARYLFDMFAMHSSRHGKDNVVRSAWYGKQTKSARHEFIVVVVEDLAIPGLKNCMAIERNQDNASTGSSSRAARASSSINARDTFKVSYDGNLTRLLDESKLTPYQILEQLYFQPDKPFSLHTLVTLVHRISGQHRKYNPLDTNCYWFTGLIWDCMRRMFPEARYEPHLPKRRGRFTLVRHITNPVQVQNVVRIIQQKTELKSLELHDSNDPTHEAGRDADMRGAPASEPATA